MLFEGWIAVLLMGILFLSMHPLWKHLWAETQLNMITVRLVRALELARIIAIRDHQFVSLCGSWDRKTCDGHWDRGFLVMHRIHFVYYVPLPKQYHIVWHSNFGKNDRVTFSPEGFTLGQQGTFYICPSYAYKIRNSITITWSGRTRINHDTLHNHC